MTAPLDKSGIIEFFLIEAGEHLQNLNRGLLALEKDPSDAAMIDELFRAAHTLKGSAAMMGFQGISDVSHRAEDMLSMYRAGNITITKATLNFLFDSVDAIKLLVDGVAAKQPEDPLMVESISRAFKEIVAGAQKTPAVEKSLDEQVREQSQAQLQQKTAADAGTGQSDDTDIDWEKAFDIGLNAALDAKITTQETQKTTQPEKTASAAAPALQAKQAPPAAKKEPEQDKLKHSAPAASTQTLQQGTQPPVQSPKQEAEGVRQGGIVEKRSLAGRRATDAAELEKQFIRVNIERLDNLMNLVGEMVVNRNRLARQVDLIKNLREELDFSQQRLLHEIKKFEEKYEYTLTIESAPREGDIEKASNDFQELEFDRYDDFNLLSRKLTEISNDTNEVMNELAGFFDSFEYDTARISTITTNLQDEITMARMVEMDKLYQMFQRPIRDIAADEEKEVNVIVSGGETKIDKTIFEIISDPLLHMVRNAVSHGLEPVAERKALGKEPAGTIVLNARHEGNSIIIQIEDDGRGMDPAVLRKAAVAKGFITQAEAQSLTDLEAINLIFRPGFSTASTITKISGRGVGMDVVANHLARINGRIEIKTAAGTGTKFIIRLPLTLAIAQSLIVKLGEQELAVPMNLVEETTRFAFKDIQRAAGDEMVNLRGTLLRLFKLNELLGAGKFPKKDETLRHPTLILGMAEKRIALMVEEIIGREEIVVKSLGEFLKGVKMFSGATISGEGNVRLIINIAALFGEEGLVASNAMIGAAAGEAVHADAVINKPRILVVDDSISIRKYLQRFLDRMGYEVEVAPDGLEALNILAKNKFDAVITDLEMPVMHGYDLMAEMRKSSDFMHIPVIVLTSRAGEKHRQKALEMGAQDYLVKPFEEQEMLSAIKKLLSTVHLAGRM